MLDPYVHVPVATFERIVEGANAELPAQDDHHVRRVLRLAAGARLILSDGRGRDAGARLTADGVTLDGDVRDHPAPTPAIHLLQGLAKARKVDEVIRAATEFGVSGVTVVAAQRSIVELRGAKQDKVRARWESVAASAAGQSRRPHLPVIAGPVASTEVASLADGCVGVLAHVGAAAGLAATLASASRDPGTREVWIAVGPEGGWTDAEVRTFGEAGFAAVSLGDSVLRTEHAGLAAAAACAALVGWMD